MRYYDLKAILSKEAQYNIVFGERSNGKTYAEQKEEERKAIERFIDLQGIKVITESEFLAKDTTTDVSKNEYVLFSESGIYMQIIERGGGEIMPNGRHEVLVRYDESRIYINGTDSLTSFPSDHPRYLSQLLSYTDTLTSYNSVRPTPDEMTVQKSGTSIQASFTNGWMQSDYNSSVVPSGWLVPFNYVKTGRKKSDRSHVKLIVPHSEGHITAKNYVYPCLYDLTFQLGR